MAPSKSTGKSSKGAKAAPSKSKGAKPAPKPSAKKPSGKGSSSHGPASKGTSDRRPAAAAPPAVETLPPVVPTILTSDPIRVLSLQFVREGDEYLARLEGVGGHITELKNRSLDQLLTMVAGELEDLLG